MTQPSPSPDLPPFIEETARRKVRLAQGAWNTRDPDRVVLAYTQDSKWRNRDEFFEGRDAIRDNRISVRFEYESRDVHGHWWRSHGNEHWEPDEQGGLMRRRDASINDYRIAPSERRIVLDDVHPSVADSR